MSKITAVATSTSLFPFCPFLVPKAQDKAGRREQKRDLAVCVLLRSIDLMRSQTKAGRREEEGTSQWASEPAPCDYNRSWWAERTAPGRAERGSAFRIWASGQVGKHLNVWITDCPNLDCPNVSISHMADVQRLNSCMVAPQFNIR